MIKNVRKVLYTLVLIIFISAKVFVPFSVFADDSSIAPTPTPETTEANAPDSSTSPPPSETSSPSSSATPTPTPCPSIAPMPENSGNSVASNGCVDNNVESSANSGNNSISTPSASLDNSSSQTDNQNNSSSISTSNSTSSTIVDNNLNSTSVNSEAIFQTINLFIDSSQNIDLSTPFKITNDIITKDNNNDPVINVKVTGVDSYSYLSNDITSTANTGDNNIAGLDNASVNTGNAYSVVSLLNKVNFTVINSKVHVVTINIFGDLNGDIILPDIGSSFGCTTCGMFLNTNSNATVSNNVNSSAQSGSNTIVSTGSSSIASGDAKSSVNLINVVNTNVVGINIAQLYINVLGGWDGNFLGWGNLGQQEAGNLLLSIISSGGSSGCGLCNSDLNLQSTAVVNNSINSYSNTGGNNINGNGNITTGNSYSAVSLINFVNANFINAWGFFGFINIFGNLKGDIGDHKAFASNDSSSSDNSFSNSTESKEENGGKLYIEQRNNTGKYVLPGDTVTFFINTKNTGLGKVYDVVVHLYLIKDGKDVGGHDFQIGDIPVGRGVNLTTGFVLSNKIPGGSYIARASVEGRTGDDPNLNAFSDSTFTVNGNYAGNTQSLVLIASDKDSRQPILAAYDRPSDPKSGSGVTMLIFLLGSSYLTIKILRRQDLVAHYLKNLGNNSILSNLHGIKSILL